MVAAQAGSPVLIVGGDISAKLELELASHGLACLVAANANDAVARMKSTRFPFVVVPPLLVDMTGVDFIHGVLRHFDASVVLYGNGVDSAEINALLRTGRVAHFPAHAEGHVIADFLARRSNGSSPPASAPVKGQTRPPPPAPAATPAVSAFGVGPVTQNQFLLTPNPPPGSPIATPTPQQSALAAALFGGGNPGSLSNVQTSFPPVSPTFPPQATTSFPPSPNPGFAATPSGGFAAFNPALFQQAQQQGAPRPPTMGPMPGFPAPQAAQSDRRVDQMVEDLARANSELSSSNARLQALEHERAALLVEVEAARRSAIADVAQVMALSDEGDPIAEEIEDLKAKIATAERERSALRVEADALRIERDRLVSEAAAKAGQLAEHKARADGSDAVIAEVRAASDAHKAQIEALTLEGTRAAAEIDAVKIERNAIMTQLEAMRGERDTHKADVDAALAQIAGFEDRIKAAEKARDEALQEVDEKADAIANAQKARAEDDAKRAESDALAEKTRADAAAAAENQRVEEALTAAQQRAEAMATIEAQRAEATAALEQRITLLEVQRNELAAALGQAQGDVGKTSDVENALRIETEKLRADVGAARTDATTVRLDLQEALMRLDESSNAMQALKEERDGLRAEAGPLREWANQLVVEHARQQGELEKMRDRVAGGEAKLASVNELQAQVSKLQAEREKMAAGGAGDDVEVVLARSRNLAGLVRALEPFMWGLTQATTFYKEANVSGGDAHMKLLQQLQGVLLRLRDEIAMLDLS